MRSVIDDALKFIKRKQSFFADYLHLCICQSAECKRPDQAKKDIKLNESNHGSPTDDLTCCVTFTNRDCGANGNKVLVHNQIMPRSRFDHFSRLGFKQSHGINNRHSDRAVSRIPTNKLKRALQKSKKVRHLLRKHLQNTVPKSSNLHKYVKRTCDMYYRLISESHGTKNVAQNSSRHWL